MLFLFFEVWPMSSQYSSAPGGRILVPDFDPRVQPIVQTQALQQLVSGSIQLDFICQAFERSIQWQVEPLFADAFLADTTHYDNVVRAAVLMPLVQRPSGLHVLFTRRASHLYDHAGQICFPGGRIEPLDTDEVAAALRETHEEIGVSPEFIQLIGTQPGFLTSTGFTMKPVIGMIRPGYTLTPDLAEVAEVFEVPLSILMDPKQHLLHRMQLPNGECRHYFSITWQSYFIWGATAALIRNLYHYLAAAQLGGTTPLCMADSDSTSGVITL